MNVVNVRMAGRTCGVLCECENGWSYVWNSVGMAGRTCEHRLAILF